MPLIPIRTYPQTTLALAMIQNSTHPAINSNRIQSYSRFYTYGGRPQGGSPPLHSQTVPPFFRIPLHPPSRNPRHSDLRQSLGMRSSGPGCRAWGLRDNRGYSSPPGVWGTTRSPHASRPVLTGGGGTLNMVKDLGSTPQFTHGASSRS